MVLREVRLKCYQDPAPKEGVLHSKPLASLPVSSSAGDVSFICLTLSAFSKGPGAATVWVVRLYGPIAEAWKALPRQCRRVQPDRPGAPTLRHPTDLVQRADRS